NVQQKEKIKNLNEKEKESEEVDDKIVLIPKLLKLVLEKRVFRVSIKFTNSLNSRRFGLIGNGEELLDNIPVPGKNFRAITYDEKEGAIRLGWLEVFRWITTTDEKRRITFELDLRDGIFQNTIRIFCGIDESPILFVNVPKQLKIYLAYDNLPNTKYDNKIFEIPKPTREKVGEYEKVIDYNMDLTRQN
ncbi:MAG: hypothetical protein EZS28_020532, partial [Streblomastix strix]